MLRKRVLAVICACGILLLFPILAQEGPRGIAAIEKAMADKNYAVAADLFKKQTNEFLSAGNTDTLIAYIPLAGRLAEAETGAARAITVVNEFVETLKSKNTAPRYLIKVYREAAEYFSNIGENQQGYNASEKALQYVQQLPSGEPLQIAQSEYNLGNYAHRLGNIALAQHHHRKALAIRLAAADPEGLYFSCNAMGAIMWYASRYDSAAILYNKALESLTKMPDNALNKYYRPANIQNNLAALYSAEGKTSEGINAMQVTISNFQQFIDSKELHPKKADAVKGLFEGIDNLAGIYKELGDYGKAGELLRYSYRQKLQKLNKSHPGIFISEILLGQHYNSIHEYDTALHYLTIGLEKLEKAEGDYLFWQADAYYAMAIVYENRKDIIMATLCYQKSEDFYEKSYQGEYDNVYMDFLRNAALFYAKNNQHEKAVAQAGKVYKYLLKVKQGSSLQGFYQLLNMAEIQYLTKHYAEAMLYSNKALTTVNEKIKDGVTMLDSVKIEVFKPRAILLHAKAAYELQPKKDSAWLAQMSARLNDALQLLEKRKVLIDDAASINVLIADNTELIDFSKKIALELYALTGKMAWLDQFINLHESGLYNRIRSRLNKKQAIRFTKLPLAVQEEEQQLKMAITASLQAEKPNSILINDYLRALANWDAHLQKVKAGYPDYYNMRYASIFKSLPQLQSSIPHNTTLVRYYFVDSLLYALVADSSHKKLLALNSRGLEEKITALLAQNNNDALPVGVLNDLYASLWQPLAADVRTARVVIIPDAFLYNLSFEVLTPQQAVTYSQLAASCLLSKHIISYQYSLFMLANDAAAEGLKKNYVAFAPGFSDEIKKAYIAAVNDSVKLDYQYLSLLPQPNTNKLAQKMKGLLDGDVFLDNASTQASFKQNADGHKIIHIGTHAEYNNISPERSRLIFAKNSALPGDTNSLYLYDVYNCNINSSLTILTACESGKPGYQDGEGMVSLAHAFNYAGSRSILTGLWKIDEQSSSMITEAFVQNLQKGMQSDAALQKAKIDYLQQAKGRLQAPAYWAGLVLMGESAISFEHKTNYLPGILAGLAILLTASLVLYQRNKGLLKTASTA